MAKLCPDNTADAELDYIAASTEITLCSTQPTTYTQAHTTYMLVNHVMAAGDFAKAQGDAGAGSRKITVAAQSGLSVTNAGTALHIALTETVGQTLRFVTTCTSQAVVVGATVDLPAFKHELGVET